MITTPEWFYREDGFIYAENYEECEVIATESEFTSWIVRTFEIEPGFEESYFFWVDFGTNQYFHLFFNQLNK